jgi:Kef-type K+ transport system membrane component KefB
MNDFAGVLLDLFLIYLLARLAGEVFERLGLPVVVGELAVGIIIGPHMLGVIGVPDRAMMDLFGSRDAATTGLEFVYQVIGQLGLIVLLFYVGLETDFERLLSVAPRAVAVAVPGAALTMFLGAGFMLALGYGGHEALFVGAAMVATSVAITARVMRGMGVLDSIEGRIILGAAVVDDIVGLLLLATVAELAKTGGVDGRALALLALEALAFVVFAISVARRLVGRYSLHLNRLQLESAPLAFALVVMLGMSALAAGIGLAGVVGAFLAGIVLSEASDEYHFADQVRPIYEFLTPFFFVFTGASVDMALFRDADTVWVTLGITLLAVVGKLIGCAAGASGLGPKSMAIVGVGMVPRGEIGFAVASIGLAIGAMSRDVFSAVVLMSIATAVISPPALQLLYGRRARERTPAITA